MGVTFVLFYSKGIEAVSRLKLNRLHSGLAIAGAANCRALRSLNTITSSCLTSIKRLQNTQERTWSEECSKVQTMQTSTSTSTSTCASTSASIINHCWIQMMKCSLNVTLFLDCRRDHPYLFVYPAQYFGCLSMTLFSSDHSLLGCFLVNLSISSRYALLHILISAVT